MKKKRILIIAYNFPPIREPQALRWLFLTKWLAKSGKYEIDLVTTRLPEYFRFMLDHIPDNNVNVYRTYIGPLQDVFYKLKAKVRREDKVFDKRLNKYGFVRKCYWAFRKFANAVLIPDLRTEWLIWGYIQAKKLINQNDYDAIISSHEPGVSHFIAYQLKKKKAIPWIADYGDPWVSSNTPGFRKWLGLDAVVERIFIKRIDRYLFTNENIRRIYTSHHRSVKPNNSLVITQGYDPDIIRLATPAKLPKDSLNIVYTGTFYKHLREPYKLLDAVFRLRDEGYAVKLFLAGNRNPDVDTFITNNHFGHAVEHLGFLDLIETISLQKGASVLLHLGNANAVQTPGKVFEYFGLNKPILMIQSNPEDEVARMIQELNRGEVAKNDCDDIETKLKRMYELWEMAALEASYQLESVEANSYQYLSKKLDSFLSSENGKAGIQW